MLTATSVVPQPKEQNGATSLAEFLFEKTGHPIRLQFHPETQVECNHCHRVSFSLVGDCIVVTQRHDSAWHKTVIPIQSLGLKRDDSIG